MQYQSVKLEKTVYKLRKRIKFIILLIQMKYPNHRICGSNHQKKESNLHQQYLQQSSSNDINSQQEPIFEKKQLTLNEFYDDDVKFKTQRFAQFYSDDSCFSNGSLENQNSIHLIDSAHQIKTELSSKKEQTESNTSKKSSNISKRRANKGLTKIKSEKLKYQHYIKRDPRQECPNKMTLQQKKYIERRLPQFMLSLLVNYLEKKGKTKEYQTFKQENSELLGQGAKPKGENLVYLSKLVKYFHKDLEKLLSKEHCGNAYGQIMLSQVQSELSKTGNMEVSLPRYFEQWQSDEQDFKEVFAQNMR